MYRRVTQEGTLVQSGLVQNAIIIFVRENCKKGPVENTHLWCFIESWQDTLFSQFVVILDHLHNVTDFASIIHMHPNGK